MVVHQPGATSRGHGARPALAQDRLSLRPDGNIVYQLRKPYYDGRTEVVFEPEAFIRRLAALIAPPWLNLTRFHGVLAPASHTRQAVIALVPPGKQPAAVASTDSASSAMAQPADDGGPVPGTARIAWAELLRRTMGIDVRSCPQCGGRMRLVQLVKDQPVIDKILAHLELPTRPPLVAPARPPPQIEFDLFG